MKRVIEKKSALLGVEKGVVLGNIGITSLAVNESAFLRGWRVRFLAVDVHSPILNSLSIPFNISKAFLPTPLVCSLGMPWDRKQL